MSWWNNAGIGNLASAALKTAQSRIDKVLDIQGEDGESPTKLTAPEPTVSPPPTSPSLDAVRSDDSEFWNTWLAADKLASSISTRSKARGSGLDPNRPKTPEVAPAKPGFSTDFFSSTLSSSLSKVQQLKKVGGSVLLKKRHDLLDKSSDSTESSTPSASVTPVKEEQHTASNMEDSSSDAKDSVSEPKTSESSSNDTNDSGQTDMDSMTNRDSVTQKHTASRPVTEPLQIDVPLASPHEPMSGTGLLATENTINMDRDAANAQASSQVSSQSIAQASLQINTKGNVQAISQALVVEETSTNEEEYTEDIDESLLAESDNGQSGWGDVSLSILTESQVSSASSMATDTDIVTVKVDSVDSSNKTAPDDHTDNDNVVTISTSDDPVEATVITSDNQPDHVTESIVKVEPTDTQMGLSIAVSENAWGIPELTDSAMDKLSTEVDITVTEAACYVEDKTISADSAKNILSESASDAGCEVVTEADNVDVEDSAELPEPSPCTAHQEDIDVEQYTAPDSDSVIEQLPPVVEESVPQTEDISTEPEQQVNGSEKEESIEEEIPSELSKSDDTIISEPARVDTTDSYITPPIEAASMDGSTDTQDELSGSNRTLTSDEFDQPRLSSESSQATLELNPDDDQLGETSADHFAEKKEDVKQETIPEETAESLSQREQAVSKSPDEESRETLISSTHSSYVKNMLEEAMVESMKDTDSHTDSHSQTSSDMVRIESGPTSGHTSADEIETNTSSDIEIISHISTPTPNGENRLFDLSPLRHALSRTMRRNSPPGHKRSDSSSSGQSRNGDDIVSPDYKLDVEAKLAAARNGKRDQKKQSDAASSSGALEADKLLKKLAETAEILDARERKVMELSRENVDLLETNNILRQQLEQSEEAREAEMTDLNTLTEEFTKRMSEAEKKIQSVIKEKEAMRKKMLDTECELARRANDKATERIMREKDEQITELLEEGEKLSKQQLQSNNIIKKLRTKERENESLLKSQKTKLDEQKEEIEKLMSVLDNKVDVEKKQSDAISQLNNAVLVQESEINRLKSELEDSVEKIRSMQVILDNSYKEIGEMHKANAVKMSMSLEQNLSAEIRAKEELQMALEQCKQQMCNEQEGLITQIEDLQLCLGRMEKDHGRREDILRQEISDLQQRLQEAEERNQELTQSVTQATRPLLRQIENLQSTSSFQVTSYEKVEKNLTDRLSEAQTLYALSQEKERSAIERVIDMEARQSTLESQVSTLRHEKSRLQAALEMEKAKLEILEDTRNNESAQLEALKMGCERDVTEIRKEKMMLENQLEMEKLKMESEKKKVGMLHEQLREKEIQWVQARKLSVSPTPTFSRESSFTMESPMNISQHEEVMEKTLAMATANGGKTSLYESLKQAGATTVLESLQAQVKMKDGEILQLQNDIHELERTRESMAKALVTLTNENEDLQDKLKAFPELQYKFQDLDQRYNALLMMYGEKVEEAQELRLDLQDVKDLYKTQINELLKTH